MQAELFFKILDAFEKLEKEQGKLGTLVGALLIIVSTMFTIMGVCILIIFNLSVADWVINQLWFN